MNEKEINMLKAVGLYFPYLKAQELLRVLRADVGEPLEERSPSMVRRRFTYRGHIDSSILEALDAFDPKVDVFDKLLSLDVDRVEPREFTVKRLQSFGVDVAE